MLRERERRVNLIKAWGALLKEVGRGVQIIWLENCLFRFKQC